jgi:rhodanese-related sulfurtransferase
MVSGRATRTNHNTLEETMTRLTLAVLAAMLAFAPAQAAQEDQLRIIEKDTSYKVKTADGEEITITRTMTKCAKNKGWLQPLIPAKGINPVVELEVLAALNDKDFVVADMREVDWHLQGTIPGAVNIPYTEISGRLGEFGCKKTEGNWDCANAKKVLGFCNGPVCPQSPSGMRAMIREGFPAEKIYYYRGGMLDWEALGLTTVEGSL